MLDFVHKLVVVEWGYPETMCCATSEGAGIGKADIPGHSSCLHGYSCGGLCLDSYFTLLPANLKSVHDSMAHVWPEAGAATVDTAGHRAAAAGPV